MSVDQEGTPSYGAAWYGLGHAKLHAVEDGEEADGLLLDAFLKSLASARAIVVPSEQLQALPLQPPSAPGQGAKIRPEEFARVRLPFADTFLDLGDEDVPCALWATLDELLDATSVTVFARTTKDVSPMATIIFVAEQGEFKQTWHVASTDASARQWAERMVDKGLRLSFAVLDFLLSANVELVPAPLTRQVRRAAERRNAKIALTVRVRSPRKATRAAMKAAGRDYSHRFEVRGHYMHFPAGTRMADADADKLVDIPGRGPCRRIWCPPHVKGPDDKPLIPKRRVVT